VCLLLVKERTGAHSSIVRMTVNARSFRLGLKVVLMVAKFMLVILLGVVCLLGRCLTWLGLLELRWLKIFV
jgi:hypothetical protein